NVNKEKSNFNRGIRGSSQELPIKGTVTDENGLPLPGVTVRVKNTTEGTSTDINGAFILSVSSQDSVEFSFIGYQIQRVKVGDQREFNIQLFPLEDQSLDEVVVVGMNIRQT